MADPPELSIQLTPTGQTPQTHRGEADAIRIAVGTSGEFSIPLAALGSPPPGATVTFSLLVQRVVDGQRVDVQRVGPITVTVPGPAFDASNWRA